MPRESGASSTPRHSYWSPKPVYTGSSAFADDDSEALFHGRLLHHRRGLAEQQLALFLGAIDGLAEIRVDLFRLGIGALGRGPRGDGFQPALEVRKLLDVLALVLVGHHPGIAGHVGDRIVAADEFAVRQALVQHTIEPVGLVDIAV